MLIKPKHEGSLKCVATVQSDPDIKPTVSNIHYLRVIGGSCICIYDPKEVPDE